MNRLSFPKFILTCLILSFLFLSAESQSFSRPPVKGNKKGIFSSIFKKSPAKKKTVKIREPRAAEKAKKKQASTEKRLGKEYEQFVKNNRKRSIEIQTPVVQERMKQNMKESDEKYKARKKNTSARSKRAGKKYR
jgi:cytochrome c556